MVRERDKDWTDDLYKKVDCYDLVDNLEQCLQCGKCVGNCPVAAITPSYNSRQIIRDILIGNMERLIKSEEIWRCLWCANCYRVCPVDIHFPFLMMELRFKALEYHYGIKYVFPFKKFALRALEEGLTFVPGTKGREKIMNLRSTIGEEPWPLVSDKAKNEFKAIFDLTGTTEWIEALNEESDNPVIFTYREGKIVDE
jgi:heterodisulfide reductase subunit C